jgi:hypothetical protein
LLCVKFIITAIRSSSGGKEIIQTNLSGEIPIFTILKVQVQSGNLRQNIIAKIANKVIPTNPLPIIFPARTFYVLRTLYQAAILVREMDERGENRIKNRFCSFTSILLHKLIYNRGKIQI